MNKVFFEQLKKEFMESLTLRGREGRTFDFHLTVSRQHSAGNLKSEQREELREIFDEHQSTS